MQLALKTLVVVMLGVVVGLALYLWLQPAYGQFFGPGGMNPNFASLVTAWRALGGTAQPLSADQLQGRRPGEAAVGLAGENRSGLGEGFEPARALPQTGSDLVWLGIPALFGVFVELVYRLIAVRARVRSSART